MQGLDPHHPSLQLQSSQQQQQPSPSPWTLVWSNSRQRYYHFNESTGECKWTLPDSATNNTASTQHIRNDASKPRINSPSDQRRLDDTGPVPTVTHSDRKLIAGSFQSSASVATLNHQDYYNPYSQIDQSYPSHLSSFPSSFARPTSSSSHGSFQQQQPLQQSYNPSIKGPFQSVGTTFSSTPQQQQHRLHTASPSSSRSPFAKDPDATNCQEQFIPSDLPSEHPHDFIQEGEMALLSPYVDADTGAESAGSFGEIAFVDDRKSEFFPSARHADRRSNSRSNFRSAEAAMKRQQQQPEQQDRYAPIRDPRFKDHRSRTNQQTQLLMTQQEAKYYKEYGQAEVDAPFMPGPTDESIQAGPTSLGMRARPAESLRPSSAVPSNEMTMQRDQRQMLMQPNGQQQKQQRQAYNQRNPKNPLIASKSTRQFSDGQARQHSYAQELPHSDGQELQYSDSPARQQLRAQARRYSDAHERQHSDGLGQQNSDSPARQQLCAQATNQLSTVVPAAPMMVKKKSSINAPKTKTKPVFASIPYGQNESEHVICASIDDVYGSIDAEGDDDEEVDFVFGNNNPRYGLSNDNDNGDATLGNPSHAIAMMRNTGQASQQPNHPGMPQAYSSRPVQLNTGNANYGHPVRVPSISQMTNQRNVLRSNSIHDSLTGNSNSNEAAYLPQSQSNPQAHPQMANNKRFKATEQSMTESLPHSHHPGNHSSIPPMMSSFAAHSHSHSQPMPMPMPMTTADARSLELKVPSFLSHNTIPGSFFSAHQKMAPLPANKLIVPLMGRDDQKASTSNDYEDGEVGMPLYSSSLHRFHPNPQHQHQHQQQQQQHQSHHSKNSSNAVVTVDSLLGPWHGFLLQHYHPAAQDDSISPSCHALASTASSPCSNSVSLSSRFEGIFNSLLSHSTNKSASCSSGAIGINSRSALSTFPIHPSSSSLGPNGKVNLESFDPFLSLMDQTDSGIVNSQSVVPSEISLLDAYIYLMPMCT